MYSRSNLFFASDLILFLPPYFEQCDNRALSTQSLSASHIAQEPSWRFTAHSFLRPAQTKLDSEINSPFLLNEHGDPRIFFQAFVKNSLIKKIFEEEKKFDSRT